MNYSNMAPAARPIPISTNCSFLKVNQNSDTHRTFAQGSITELATHMLTVYE